MKMSCPLHFQNDVAFSAVLGAVVVAVSVNGAAVDDNDSGRFGGANADREEKPSEECGCKSSDSAERRRAGIGVFIMVRSAGCGRGGG